jgi:hypothetical protein
MKKEVAEWLASRGISQPTWEANRVEGGMAQFYDGAKMSVVFGYYRNGVLFRSGRLIIRRDHLRIRITSNKRAESKGSTT